MAALQSIVLVAYPFAVYFALGVASPRVIGLVTLAFLGLRLAWLAPGRLAAVARVFGPAALVYGLTSLVAAVASDARALLLAPALFSFALLAVFASSLARSESAIEILARAQVGELPADEVPYCRSVTLVWCAFFALNGALSAGLALFGSRESWAVWSGALSYALMGAVFAGEYVYRHWRFRRYRGGVADPLLRRLFPPPGEPSLRR